MSLTQEMYFEYLYKEYGAINEKLDEYAKSSFDDFKLLAVPGLIVAWPPLSNAVASLNSPDVLLLGFLVILLAVSAIDARDNLKHSVIRYYRSQAKLLEEELVSLSGQPETNSFHMVRNWNTWYVKKHRALVTYFLVLIYIIVVAIPLYALAIKTSIGYVVVYAIACMVAVIFSYFSVRTLREDVVR